MVTFNTPFKPTDVGYKEERLEVLNDLFQDMIEKDQIQAAGYCLARDGKVFSHASLGQLSFRHEDPRELLPDTIFRIASITKLFTAVAIFKLVEDGKIILHQKVGEFIEEFSHPPFNEISVANLLSHTSGLQPDPNCFENPYYMTQWDHIANGFKNGEDNWIKSALRSGMRTKPDVEWAYSSFGFVILGEIITRVSGMFVHDYIEEYILKPCEMFDSGFDDRSKKIASRRMINNERVEEYIQKILSDTYESDKEEERWNKIPSTGGGLFSTTLDLIKFGTMLLQGGSYNGKHVISRKAIEKMTARVTSSNIKDFCWNAGGVERPYGLGPDLRGGLTTIYSNGTFMHEGAGACSLIIDPVEKMVAAYCVPFMYGGWHQRALYGASAVMWSGLE